MNDHSPRKRPQQARSRATFDAIVEACAQLLVEVGFHNCSTNKVAERAGVSIGSLYQYFPNKEAVVATVVEDFAERQFDILVEGLEEVQDAPLEVGVRKLLENMFEAKKAEPDLSRVLFEELPPVGQLDVMRDWTERACLLVRGALEARRDEVGPEDLELAAFLLVNACHGIVHSAVIDRPELLDEARLPREASELIVGYLKG